MWGVFKLEGLQEAVTNLGSGVTVNDEEMVTPHPQEAPMQSPEKPARSHDRQYKGSGKPGGASAKGLTPATVDANDQEVENTVESYRASTADKWDKPLRRSPANKEIGEAKGGE